MRRERSHRNRNSGLALSLQRAFTLTELMVAVVVLIVVIIATSQIFGTASRITGLGQATSSVMTEAATIERQMRDDIARLTTEGFFAIRCVRVPNNINGSPLLNPNLPANATLRADQLVFFANGVVSPQTFRLAAGSSSKGQATAFRVYWGHAFQVPNAMPCVVDPANGSIVRAHDPGVNLAPWERRANTIFVTTLFSTTSSAPGGGAGTGIFGAATPIIQPASMNIEPQPATRWLLARQPVVLADDDESATNSNSKTVFLMNNPAARSIFINANNSPPWGFSREVRNGRLDAAASQMDDIRRWVLYATLAPTLATAQRSLAAQRTIMQGAVYYPRAERRAPSGHRVDQALTNHIIGNACSSFSIDWTYEDGVGYAENAIGAQFGGVAMHPSVEHPWFGLTDLPRGVVNYGNWPLNVDHGARATTILPANIESEGAVGTTTAQEYWAVFGYNQTQPLNENPASALYGQPDASLGYAPFPTALRITMTLHDAEGRLEGGREFQFVVKLPRRMN